MFDAVAGSLGGEDFCHDSLDLNLRLDLRFMYIAQGI